MDCEASMCGILERMLFRDQSGEPPSLRISFLESITNNFSDDQKIGSGGFAVVYKGLLENGMAVAVKKLKQSQTVDIDETKFMQEVVSLMKVNHKNIVRFLGYCADTKGKVHKYEGKNVMLEERQRFLCFEFLPQRSLDKYITDASGGLEWRTRYQIIKGICAGLHYLHQQRIVHLDLKPANILMDHDMVPKIADFGLAKCFDEEQTRAITSNVIGSKGYMAPEYVIDGVITLKSDIYSLGVIIIEIVTGQKVDRTIENNVLESWKTRFGTSEGDTRLEQVKVCSEIGIKCTDFDPANRPDTQCIIETLEKMERTCGFSETDLCTSSATHVLLGSSETSKLLDVHPLEVRFPFEPNKRIRCPVSLTNTTGKYVGVWITPACTDTPFDLCFPDSWDHESEEEDDDESEEDEFEEELSEEEEDDETPEEDKAPKDPSCTHFFQIMEPHSTWVVAMTMKEQHEMPPPPRATGKFEVVTITMGTQQDLKILEPFIGNKPGMDNDLLKRVEGLGGKVHPVMLTAAICDPARCEAAAVTQQVISTEEFGDPLYIDVDSTKSWILCAHDEGYVCIWNYQTKERVMALQIIKKDTYLVSATKFITRKQWFAAGDDRGYVHVYDYTTKDKVKKFKAHRGKPVSSLAVHPTYPFLLSSSDEDHSSIKLWDWDQGWVCTRTFDGHTRGVLRLMFNPSDIDTFASVSDDDTAKIWNIRSSNPITTLTSVDAYSADYFFTDSHRPLLITSDKQTGCACIWDLQTKEPVHRLAMCGTNMDHVVCHPTLPILVTTSWNRNVCLWDANTYRLEKIVRLTRKPVEDLVFVDTEDLTRLVVGCEDGIGILEVTPPAIMTDL